MDWLTEVTSSPFSTIVASRETMPATTEPPMIAPSGPAGIAVESGSRAMRSPRAEPNRRASSRPSATATRRESPNITRGLCWMARKDPSKNSPKPSGRSGMTPGRYETVPYGPGPPANCCCSA